MKKFMITLLLSVALGMTSCDIPAVEATQPSDQVAAQQQEKMMKEASSELGMPAITNFQEKKVMKMILEMRDRADLVCYAYLVSRDAKLVFIGKCIGYGLPYCTQYTNPMKTVDKEYGEYGSITTEQLPQADPNGLFMPDGLSATWLLLIDPVTSEPTPVYIEPEIVVSPFKLH